MKYATTRSIQRTQTPPRLSPLTCDVDLMTRSRTLKLSKILIIHFCKYSLTRNSEGKILMRHCNTNLRKFYFSNRIISNWNSLPYNVKNANTLNDFKIFIDRDTKLGDSFYGYDYLFFFFFLLLGTESWPDTKCQ